MSLLPRPRFMMFVLSLLRETKSGADTSGPASLSTGTFPDPPRPALLARAHTHPHSITFSHTRVSTQVHKPTPLVHTQMHTHTIFAFIPTHFSRTLTLARVISSYSRTNAHALVHTHNPHTCTFTSIHAFAWRPIFPFPVTCPPSGAHRCPHHTHVLESPLPHSCTHKHARLLTGTGSCCHRAPSRPP